MIFFWTVTLTDNAIDSCTIFWTLQWLSKVFSMFFALLFEMPKNILAFFYKFWPFCENLNSWPENEIFKGIHFRSESVEFSSHCQKVTKMECLDEIMGLLPLHKYSAMN